jgi:hypothetical protein
MAQPSIRGACGFVLADKPEGVVLTRIASSNRVLLMVNPRPFLIDAG